MRRQWDWLQIEEKQSKEKRNEGGERKKRKKVVYPDIWKGWGYMQDAEPGHWRVT